jgi:hypothetical protein
VRRVANTPVPYVSQVPKTVRPYYYNYAWLHHGPRESSGLNSVLLRTGTGRLDDDDVIFYADLDPGPTILHV